MTWCYPCTFLKSGYRGVQRRGVVRNHPALTHFQGGPSNQNIGSFTVVSLWCILHGCHLPSPIFVLEKSVQMLGELVSSVDILNELTI